MPDVQKTTAHDSDAEAAALAAALPGDLLAALVHWYRAYHHGPSSEHERLVEERLAAAIERHIDALKARLEAHG